MSFATRQPGSFPTSESRVNHGDERLVAECLAGSEEAWSALIDRYKNLIFSIPLKHGLTRDDAAEVFQSVCLELLNQLPKLRQPKAIAGWLIQVTSHRVLRHQQQQRRTTDFPETLELPSPRPSPDRILRELEREQALREAIRELKPRCRALVDALFFEDPPRSYDEVAASMGVAIGSIGFIRGRCLRKLRALLEGAGF